MHFGGGGGASLNLQRKGASLFELPTFVDLGGGKWLPEGSLVSPTGDAGRNAGRKEGMILLRMETNELSAVESVEDGLGAERQEMIASPVAIGDNSTGSSSGNRGSGSGSNRGSGSGSTVLCVGERSHSIGVEGLAELPVPFQHGGAKYVAE